MISVSSSTPPPTGESGRAPARVTVPHCVRPSRGMAEDVGRLAAAQPPCIARRCLSPASALGACELDAAVAVDRRTGDRAESDRLWVEVHRRWSTCGYKRYVHRRLPGHRRPPAVDHRRSGLSQSGAAGSAAVPESAACSSSSAAGELRRRTKRRRCTCFRALRDVAKVTASLASELEAGGRAELGHGGRLQRSRFWPWTPRDWNT